jgi:hypothetical protein
MAGTGIGLIGVLILVPLLIVLGMFIGSAIIHLCLMIVGGAKQTFETTFRVVCFATGSSYPLMIVPFCGGLISGIWGLVAECIGLSRAHEIEIGRAILAILLPLVVCCGGAFFLTILLGGIAGFTQGTQ